MDKNKIAVHLAKQVASVQATAPADLEALKALALAATPGPWFANDWSQDGGPNKTTVETRKPEVLHPGQGSIWPGGVQCSRVAETEDAQRPLEDAAYIAAASPAVVLALIDRIARAEAPAASGDALLVLRDQIGQAIADYAAEHMNLGGRVGIDWCSANDIDPLADRIIALLPSAAVSAATKPAALEALRVGQQAVPEGWRATLEHAANKLVTHSRILAYNADALKLVTELRTISEALADGALLQEKAAPARETPESMANSNTRFAIDGAIQYGRENRNALPSADHWLYEYWNIGQQLRELGKTGWDNVTPMPEGTAELVSSGAPSAEDVRDAALEEAIEVCKAGRAWRLVDDIRALKGKSGGSDDVREGAQ